MPERILACGPPGVGKTYQLLKTAEMYKDRQFFVLDTDNAYPRCMEEFGVMENVHVTPAFDWQDYVSWIEYVAVDEQDWLVVDRMDSAWTEVQEYFSEEVYGKSSAERLMEARKRSSEKRQMMISGNDMADWQTINAQYYGWCRKLLRQAKCNLYLTSGVSKIYGNDDDAIKNMFGKFGYKPATRDNVAHAVDTILLFTMDKQGVRRVSTANKDRAREMFEDHALISFPVQYLMGKAGWSNE